MNHRAKIAIGLLLGTLTACNSATDPGEAGTYAYKNCIDDFRRIVMVAPREADLAEIRSGEALLIQWAAIQVCGGYTVTVTVMFNEQEIVVLADAANATSCIWNVPLLPTQRCGDSFSIAVHVEARDLLGVPIPSDEVGVMSVIRCDKAPVGRGQQRD